MQYSLRVFDGSLCNVGGRYDPNESREREEIDIFIFTKKDLYRWKIIR